MDCIVVLFAHSLEFLNREEGWLVLRCGLQEVQRILVVGTLHQHIVDLLSQLQEVSLSKHEGAGKFLIANTSEDLQIVAIWQELAGPSVQLKVYLVRLGIHLNCDVLGKCILEHVV